MALVRKVFAVKFAGYQHHHGVAIVIARCERHAKAMLLSYFTEKCLDILAEQNFAGKNIEVSYVCDATSDSYYRINIETLGATSHGV